MKRSEKTKPAVATEIPEVDIKRARVVGIGTHFRRVATESRYVQLDPDVFKDFKTAKAVNDTLRQFWEIRRIVLAGVRKRKTA
jgi:hypothetical protein